MTDLKPDLNVAIKMASAIVHADEFMSPGGAPEDEIAFRSSLDDPEVKSYMEKLGGMALLPVKR